MPPARQGCVHSQKIKLWFTDSRILSPSDLQLLILGLCYKWLWGLNQKKLEVGETRKDFSVSSFSARLGRAASVAVGEFWAVPGLPAHPPRFLCLPISCVAALPSVSFLSLHLVVPPVGPVPLFGSCSSSAPFGYLKGFWEPPFTNKCSSTLLL